VLPAGTAFKLSRNEAAGQSHHEAGGGPSMGIPPLKFWRARLSRVAWSAVGPARLRRSPSECRYSPVLVEYLLFFARFLRSDAMAMPRYRK
jgi:hypothetical protein